MSTTVDIVKRGRGIGGKPNIPAAERKMIRTLLGYSVGYNISDKMLGPVLYSRDLYLDQCKLHLEDGKGTYERISESKKQILVSVVDRLKCLLTAYSEPGSAVEQLSKTFLKWASASLERDKLCKFYVIWKLHKKANALGVRSRPIASNIGYPTGQVSHFLHCQLRDAVLSHEFVLKDSISLIRQLECMNISQTQDVILTSADVAALYPSINLEDGLTAMQWFMTRYTSIPLGLQRLYIRLAQFVLENNYVECDGLPDAYLQKIGTAMGTSFSVTYATIFMIWLETPIIEEFRAQILLYKRFLDDIFMIWSGSSAELFRLQAKFESVNNPAIKSVITLEWQGMPSAGGAADPAVFDRTKHRRVNFLDLDIKAVYTTTMVEFEFGVYRKPGNAYAYLPYGSYHSRHVFRGWLKAEMHRLLTHSSNINIWLEECHKFYDHLRARGYPARAIDATFRKVSWNQRSKLLEPKVTSKADNFFTLYNGCVFSSTNAPGIALLQERMDLSLQRLQEEADGCDIFPPRAFFTLRSAKRLGAVLRR